MKWDYLFAASRHFFLPDKDEKGSWTRLSFAKTDEQLSAWSRADWQFLKLDSAVDWHSLAGSSVRLIWDTETRIWRRQAAMLKILGAMGWELVTVYPSQMPVAAGVIEGSLSHVSWYDLDFTFILKRPEA